MQNKVFIFGVELKINRIKIGRYIYIYICYYKLTNAYILGYYSPFRAG